MPEQLFRLLTASQATLKVPCLPASLPLIMERLEPVLQQWSRFHDFHTDQAFFAQVREVLRTKLEGGFALSATNHLNIQFGATPPGQQLQLSINLVESEPGQALVGADAFGSHPDARALDLAPEGVRLRILDLGSGPGRNALALARRGHFVLALDSEPAYVRRLVLQRRLESLDIDPVEADLRQVDWPLEPGTFDLALAVGLAPHARGLGELQHVFAESARAVRTDGHLLVNLFLHDDGYVPDLLTLEMAQAVWSFFCGRDELDLLLADWALEDLTEAISYERSRAAPETWPPTVWFEPWAEGRNLFPQAATPPIRLFWALLRRR